MQNRKTFPLNLYISASFISYYAIWLYFFIGGLVFIYYPILDPASKNLDNDYFYDAIASIILTVIYSISFIIFMRIKNNFFKRSLYYKASTENITTNKKQSDYKYSTPDEDGKKYNSIFYLLISLCENNRNNVIFCLILCIIVVLGFGTIANLWLKFASTLKDSFFGDSYSNFNNSWSDINNYSYLYVFLSVVFFGPIAEELMFRGLIYNAFSFINKPIIPILISALAFGIWHGEPVQAVYTTIMGIMVGIIYYYTGNILYPIFAHILNNFLSSPFPIMDTDIFYTITDNLGYICCIPAIIIVIILYITKRQADKKELLENNN